MKTIITISRQYGSGGREIGRKLAEQLGVPFYDNEIISRAAKETGFSEAAFETVEDKAEKIHGLNTIMAHYVPGKSFEFSDGNVKAVGVFKLEVREISAKLHS